MFAAYNSIRPVQVPLVGVRYQMGSQWMGQTPKPVEYPCPVTTSEGHPSGASAFAVTEDSTLNCMRDARGNTICSDGGRYPPGCPHTPPDQYFTPGITPDVTTGGRIEGQQPAPRGGGSAPAPGAAASSGGSSIVPIAAGAASLTAIGAIAYFLFK